MDFIELFNASGMKLKEFSEYFEIPQKTIEHWKYGRRECAPYLIELMYYKLKNEKIIK